MSKRNHFNGTGAGAKMLCGLSIALACAPAWSDSNNVKYTMTVLRDTAYGSKIMEQKYEQAIDKIKQRPGRYDAFSKGTNLCVAYTKSGELDLAEEACEAAVAAARTAKLKQSRSAFSDPVNETRVRNLAVALSNRGVLRAVNGQSEEARDDFNAALALDTRLSAPKVNLARLGNGETDPA
ncbi:MAG: hypothetical protein P8X81_02015 [Woeseiaceae bacterium]|jgi:tetratricopeptide (TPR) repeat protein